jgi:transposase
MSRAVRANYDQIFLLPRALDEWVPAEHPARFIRDFVDELPLETLGLRTFPGKEGRPHYAPDMLLKVWLYGWMTRVRSCRGLEKACFENMPFLWLTGNNHPDHNTLWRFFRDNKKALRKLFKLVVQVAVKNELVGFALHALDGTKIVAASSMEKALHRKSLEEELKKLDATIDEQMKQIEQSENTTSTPGFAMPWPLQNAQTRKEEIRKAMAELDAAEVNHLHADEPEARVMKTRGHQTLAYNAQAIVDHDSDMIVAADVVTQAHDNEQLVPMVEQVQETLGQTAEQTVADAGYYGGEQIATAEKRHLPVIVAIQEETGTKGEFNKSHFVYDMERRGYVCPRDELLPLEMKLKPTKETPYPLEIYRCHNQQCPVRMQCSADKKGRSIRRTPFEDALKRQAQKQSNPAMKILLSLRKEIVEHLFAIIKTIDGFRRFTVRGIENVNAQWALVCTAVNLRKMYAFWLQGRFVLRDCG